MDNAVNEAKRILEEMKNRDEEDWSNLEHEANQGSLKAADLLKKMREFTGPPDNMSESLEVVRDRIFQLDKRLKDLLSRTQEAEENAHKVEDLNNKNRYAQSFLYKILYINNIKHVVQYTNLFDLCF